MRQLNLRAHIFQPAMPTYILCMFIYSYMYSYLYSTYIICRVSSKSALLVSTYGTGGVGERDSLSARLLLLFYFIRVPLGLDQARFPLNSHPFLTVITSPQVNATTPPQLLLPHPRVAPLPPPHLFVAAINCFQLRNAFLLTGRSFPVTI